MTRFTKLPLALFLAGVFLLFQSHQALAKFVPETHAMIRTNSARQHISWRTIEIKLPPKAPKIHFYQKLNPIWWLKNSDDPKPPAWYRPDEKFRGLKWSFRNPLHNFDFYIIGVADKPFYRSGRFPEKNSDPRGGWDFEAASRSLSGYHSFRIIGKNLIFILGGEIAEILELKSISSRRGGRRFRCRRCGRMMRMKGTARMKGRKF